MRRCAVGLAAFVAAVGAWTGAAEPPKPDFSPDRVAWLIQQLGSPRFTEREAASESLDALGDAALTALKSAATSGDAEIRRRATELLDRILQRAAVAQLLKPTMISLKFNNTPLEDAVKSLASISGQRIELARGPHWAARKVSVESGPLPIWEAIDLFCRKADLHEWDGFTPIANSSDTPPAPPQPNVVFGGIQGQVIVNGRLSRSPGIPEPKIVLMNGPISAIANYDAGAVRLRLLPPGTPFPISTIGEETALPLQVSAEPRLRWAGILGVRVDRAINEFGTERSVVGVVAPTVQSDEMMWMMMPNGAMMPTPATGGAGLAALKVTRPDRVAKSVLKEIVGELTARVAITEALARLESPLKSGSAIEAATGVSMKITDVAAPADGEMRLAIDLQIPPDVQPVGPLAVGMNNRMVFAGGMVIQQQIVVGGKQATIPALAAGTTEYNGLSLEDQHGRRWPAIRAAQESMQLNMQGMTAKLIVIFKSPAADAIAARLVFRGSRPATISIPFRFQDVDLK